MGLTGTVHMEDAAIKMFKGTFKGSDAHETELLQEIAILERAKTKYVTRFLGYSVCREGIILCMEFCEGGTAFPAAALRKDRGHCHQQAVLDSASPVVARQQLRNCGLALHRMHAHRLAWAQIPEIACS